MNSDALLFTKEIYIAGRTSFKFVFSDQPYNGFYTIHNYTIHTKGVGVVAVLAGEIDFMK